MGHTLDPTLIPIWIRFIPTHVGHTIPSGIGIPPHPVHPHIRGAYASSSRFLCRSHGSSPHTWGILSSTGGLSSAPRFIPTYVGHTNGGRTAREKGAVHPHIRGAYHPPDHPPPPLRRFIPTYVGHTSRRSMNFPLRTVHPHIRGAYVCVPIQNMKKFGSSPHTWGIRRQLFIVSAERRFIPTYVGHTKASWEIQAVYPVHPHIRGAYVAPKVPTSSATVHPHIRGAYEHQGLGVNAQNGSSPHTWGIRTICAVPMRSKRFIPTYVGHTYVHLGMYFPYPVHPHIRGAYGDPRTAQGQVDRFIPTYVGHTLLTFTTSV